MKKSYLLIFLFSFSTFYCLKSQESPSLNSGSNIACSLAWQDAVLGNCIGINNSLLSFDYLQDGTMDMIAMARISGGSTEYLWYILTYIPETGEYKQAYISEPYERDIIKIALANVDGQGAEELLVLQSETLQIIDLNSFEELASIRLRGIDSFRPAEYIQVGDVDNDQQDEVLVGSSNKLLVINSLTNHIELELDKPDGEFALGNVDSDGNVELVLSNGEIFEVVGDSIRKEYMLPLEGNRFASTMELVDMDGDSFQEVLLNIGFGSRIVVYDAELESPKKEIPVSLPANSRILKDINGDEVPELLYRSDRQIIAYDFVADNTLWRIDNLSGFSSINGLALGDFDGDSEMEISWGSGCSGSDENFLRVFDLSSREQEWRSSGISGPYQAIKVEDINEDGRLEIIAFGNTGRSFFSRPSLSIYDAVTKELIFRSDLDQFQEVDEPIRSFDIYDFGGDGDLDLVFGAADFSRSAIYVVDGDSYSVEQRKGITSSENLRSFYGMVAEDLDGDEQAEIVTISDDRLRIWNGNTIEVVQRSIQLGSRSTPGSLKIGDIEGDGNKDILFTKGFLYVYDAESFVQMRSSDENYTFAILDDWNSDGILEIVAGQANGDIQVLDGTTLEILSTYQLSEEPIHSISEVDLDGNGESEWMVTSSGKLFFVTKFGGYISSQSLGSEVGRYEGVVVKDYDEGTGSEILVGSNYRIVELDPACTSCLFFETELELIDPSCDLDNGKIIATSNDSTTQFIWSDSTFTDSLFELSEGAYTIQAITSSGCSNTQKVLLRDRKLRAEALSLSTSCTDTTDGKALVKIFEGSEPYSINWSDGNTGDTISNLIPGIYSVEISDALGCVVQDTVEVSPSELISTLSLLKSSCEGQANGSAELLIRRGEAPFKYRWDGAEGEQRNDSLAPGVHEIEVSDSRGCLDSYQFLVDTAFLEIEATQFAADCNGEQGGMAFVTVKEGRAPYAYSWSDGLPDLEFQEGLGAGTYQVSVMDANQCMKEDTVVINEGVLRIQIESQPVRCFGESDGRINVEVLEGTPPYSFQWADGNISPVRDGLEADWYYILVSDSVGCNQIARERIASPDPLSIGLTLTEDSLATPRPEGSIQTEVFGGSEPYFYIWDNGANQPNLEELYAGAYFLVVIDINACILDTLIQLGDIPIGPLGSTQSIVISPNPADGQFLVEFEGEDVLVEALKLIRQDGQEISLPFSSFDKRTLQVSSNQVIPGAYLLKIQAKDRSFYQRVIIQ